MLRRAGGVLRAARTSPTSARERAGRHGRSSGRAGDDDGGTATPSAPPPAPSPLSHARPADGAPRFGVSDDGELADLLSRHLAPSATSADRPRRPGDLVLGSIRRDALGLYHDVLRARGRGGGGGGEGAGENSPLRRAGRRATGDERPPVRPPPSQACALFGHLDGRGEPWSAVLRRSARAEFEAARAEGRRALAAEARDEAASSSPSSSSPSSSPGAGEGAGPAGLGSAAAEAARRVVAGRAALDEAVARAVARQRRVVEEAAEAAASAATRGGNERDGGGGG